MIEYKVGDFGEAHCVKIKWGQKWGVTCHGSIQVIEKKHVLFKDNEDFLYLCDKKEFTFKKHRSEK